MSSASWGSSRPWRRKCRRTRFLTVFWSRSNSSWVRAVARWKRSSSVWGGGILVLFPLDPLEKPVHDAEMIVKVRVQRRAEPMQEADGAHRGRCRCGGTGLPEGGLEGSKQDVQDRCGGPGPVMEEGPEAFGNGEDDLADGYVGKNVIHQVRCSLGHAPGVARGTGAPPLAGKGHEEVVAAGCASSPGEAMSQDATPQVAPELLFHMIRHAVAHGIGLVGQGEVGLQVFPDDAVQGGAFGPAPTIGLGTGAGRWPGWRSGPPGLPVGGVSLCGHQWPLTSTGTVEYVSTSKREMGRGGGMGKGGRRGSWCPEE